MLVRYRGTLIHRQQKKPKKQKNGKPTLENYLSISLKVIHTPTVRSSHFTLRYLPKKNENMYINVHRSFTCKSQ